MQHLVNGSIHKFGNIVIDFVLHTRWEIGLEFFKFFFCFFNHRAGIRAKILLEYN